MYTYYARCCKRCGGAEFYGNIKETRMEFPPFCVRSDRVCMREDAKVFQLAIGLFA